MNNYSQLFHLKKKLFHNCFTSKKLFSQLFFIIIALVKQCSPSIIALRFHEHMKIKYCQFLTLLSNSTTAVVGVDVKKLSEFHIDCHIGIIYYVSSPLNDVESVSNTHVLSSILVLNILRQVKSFNVLSSEYLSLLITFYYAKFYFK